MSTTTDPATRLAEGTTMIDVFAAGLERWRDVVLVRTKEDETAWTWGEVDDRARAVAAGYRELGVGRGTAVALLLGNRPEFYVADLGAMMLGAVPVSIYLTSSAEQVAYVTSDSGARVLVTDGERLEIALAAREDPESGIEHVVVVDGDAPDGTMTVDEVAARGSGPVDDEIAAVNDDDLLTLIYTSGTTGPPKGVELTHRNLIAAMRNVGAVAGLEPGGRVVSWLPAAHIAERGAHYYAPLLFGLEITTCPEARRVTEYLAAVRPSWFFAVPRIWEKMKAGLESMLAQQSEEARAPLERAIARATEKVRLEQAGEEVPADLAAEVAAADQQTFAPLRGMLGLDQASSINVGAAPTAPEIITFFHAIGLPVAEIWGMSETCACGTLNPPDRIKIGSAGPVVPGMEMRLGDDGEVFLRGATVMRGYHDLPEKTAEVVDEDGWYATGDVGRIDDDGYLWLLDRKKELIISAGGKNMSPANIEGTLKAAHGLIGQVCVIGNGRSYNTALIVLDADTAPGWAAQQGIEVPGDADPLAFLADRDEVVEEVQRGVDAANRRLSRVEEVKRFHLVRGDWEPGGTELTPTMKLRRKPIDAAYADEIEALYVR